MGKKIKDKFKNDIGPWFKRTAKYIYNTWIFKCFLLALGIELLLEILGRRSIIQGALFMFKSPVVFFYNASIVFFTLLFALFLRKRIFALTLISLLWLICGIVNFVVLGYRVTPFAAIDFVMVEDVISMIDVYFKRWQLVLIAVAAVGVIAGLVVLFLKTPRFSGDKKIKTTMIACVVAWFGLSLLTRFNIDHNIISDDFANLGTAYKEYGFAYCFTNSIIDNGIEEPEDYAKGEMQVLKRELDSLEYGEPDKKPNIIFIQLESFIDPKLMAGVEFSRDPVPNFTALKEKYPSGYLTVPSLGTGTANTEFEMLTGLKSGFFGAGEYPYKTTVNNTPVESLCSILKRQGYGAYAIHNNKGSFYDRFDVYDEMGFDAFISLEYMYNIEETSVGWAKDKTLPDDIMKCLKDSKQQDLVYTISVQGHGRYPDTTDSCENHVLIAYEDESLEHELLYYVNQTYEMDMMIADLIERLDEFGEDYVLVLYGDHLPTLITEEEQLTVSNLFQTEYVIVNNIGLDMPDRDLTSYEFSTWLLDNLGIDPGYAQKCQLYFEDEEEMEENLELIAYDMLFGDRYLYYGNSPVEETEMRYGVDEIKITKMENVGDHIVVTGQNFNDFSVLYEDGEELDTTCVDRNTLLIEDTNATKGVSYEVKQVDESHHVRSSSEIFIY